MSQSNRTKEVDEVLRKQREAFDRSRNNDLGVSPDRATREKFAIDKEFRTVYHRKEQQP
jgi:hypothetical protein